MEELKAKAFDIIMQLNKIKSIESVLNAELKVTLEELAKLEKNDK